MCFYCSWKGIITISTNSKERLNTEISKEGANGFPHVRVPFFAVHLLTFWEIFTLVTGYYCAKAPGCFVLGIKVRFNNKVLELICGPHS